MPNGRPVSSRLLSLVLLAAALPAACAVGVDPEVEDEPMSGAGTGGKPSGAGGSASSAAGMAPKAGTGSSSAGTGSNPFGGSGGMGGKPATGGGGTSTAGAGGTSAGGTSAGGTGAGGGAAGSNSSGAGGSGCGCAKTVIWADNTNVSWVSGDCVSVSGKNYLYTGTKAQTYALGDCNPTAQQTWCTDMGTDYKFMACP